MDLIQYKTIEMLYQASLLSHYAIKMVGESGVVAKQFTVEDLFTEKQLHHIVKKYVQDEWQLLDSQVAPAAEGIAGFLGDHLKVTLTTEAKEVTQKIHLFVKRLPYENKPKAEFIVQNNFYKREMLVFQLLEEIVPVEGPPCYTKALLYNDSILVLPDLSVQGYRARPPLQPYDLPHALAALRAVAHFHATVANYETNRKAHGTYNFLQEYGHIVYEPNFVASPWLRTAAKLTFNLTKIFSTKYKDLKPEEKVYDAFVAACDSLKEDKETLNVIVHKDLWANNIMFRYEDGVPVNAILIDFQCVRYAPPTFDVMALLYLNTTKSFREQHEANLLHYYYSTFTEALDKCTKRRVADIGYTRDRFLEWCERSRMFGMVEALGIFPYVLMDPVTAQRTYDEPSTYEEYLVVDRTAPVAAHARSSPQYRERQVDASEEFLERYLLTRP